MFSDAAIHFLQTFQSNIVTRWLELSHQELNPDLLRSPWFSDESINRLYGQLIDAFQRRVYRELNRTIESMVHSEETPSPLAIKTFLSAFARAAFEEFELREATLRDAPDIRSGLHAVGSTLKRVYSERFCPPLMAVLDHNRDELAEQWLRDLPTPRISDLFALLHEDDRKAFVDQTIEVYEAVLRGRELDLVPHPTEPQQSCTVLEAWIQRQVEYFTPKGFAVVDLIKAVQHFPSLLEPLLAQETTADAWAYRTSQLLLDDAEEQLVRGLAEEFMERFSRNFYGEVGIMLHRIKNKLTSVPSTLRTILAVADEEYGAMFDPMVLTIDEARLWSEYDRLAGNVVQATEALFNGPLSGVAEADEVDAEKVRPLLVAAKAARDELKAFTAEHEPVIDTIRTMKLSEDGAAMLDEMLHIVFEGGVQTQDLTQDLQLRMTEMYERETPRYESLVISELVSAACEEAAVDARAKGIDFVYLDEADGTNIYGVRRDISRPFVQVIDNAIKYTPGGGDVVVTLKPDGQDHVLFSVKDTGIGIPPGEEEQVFSLCERCSNAKEFANGTGTGLYHDRITVLHHNGEMWVESPGVGQGSTFYIRLPVYREGPDREGSAAASVGA